MRQKRISVEIDIPITPEPSDSENDTDDDCSSHEEYVPSSYVPKSIQRTYSKASRRPPPQKRLSACYSSPPAKAAVPTIDPFEFHEEDETDIGHYKSCLTIVNTSELLPASKPDKEAVTAASVTPTAPTEKPIEVKRRRISIQNDATPIRNKDSPIEHPSVPTATPASTASKKGRRRRGRGRPATANKNPQAKRLSSIPAEIFIECIQSTPKQEQQPQIVKSEPPPRRGGRRPRLKSPPPITPTATPKNKPMPSVKGRRKSKISEVLEPKKSSRTNMRSSDASMRTTRAQDWKWENVLLTNPERILRKK